jgi:site-specific recombinase XerD
MIEEFEEYILNDYDSKNTCYSYINDIKNFIEYYEEKRGEHQQL